MLEKIKTLYNPIPGMPADKIGPTVGQNSEYRRSAPLPGTRSESYSGPNQSGR